jgi:hypothetical protein
MFTAFRISLNGHQMLTLKLGVSGLHLTVPSTKIEHRGNFEVLLLMLLFQHWKVGITVLARHITE